MNLRLFWWMKREEVRFSICNLRWQQATVKNEPEGWASDQFARLANALDTGEFLGLPTSHQQLYYALPCVRSGASWPSSSLNDIIHATFFTRTLLDICFKSWTISFIQSEVPAPMSKQLSYGLVRSQPHCGACLLITST